MTGWRFPRLMAHRCGGALAPENTLAGLRVAARMGYRAVEFDVMLSADGVPVLIHDETLERTTDGAGTLSARPVAELQRLDAGSYFHRSFAGERVPTFENALSMCRELGLWPNVEVKPSAGSEAATALAVVRVLRAHWPAKAGPPLLSSFSEKSLETLHREAAEYPRALLVGSVPPDWRARLERLGCCSLHVAARELRPSDASAVCSAGFGLAAYTVNDLESASRLWDMGVDALFTDRLDLFPGEEIRPVSA